MSVCEQCARPGPGCGFGEAAHVQLPDVVSGEPTVVRQRCGAARRYLSYPPPAGNAVDWSRDFATTLPATATRWVGAEKRAADARRSRPAGPIQPRLRDALVDVLDRADHDRAVGLWNESMRGIAFNGEHATALAVLNGSFAHPRVPDPPPYNPAWFAPLDDGEVWSARIWLTDPSGQSHAGGLDLASYDVNGMYTSAAGCDLGTGEPVYAPSAPLSVVKLPGYVRVRSVENAPHGLTGRLEPGMWVPCPIVDYLIDVGASVGITEALYWPVHRKWLDPQVSLIRGARLALTGRAGDPAAAAVAAIVKDVANRMFGGLLRSTDHNRGPGLNRGWADMVPAVGQARMFRGLDRIEANGVTGLVGIYVDAAWLTLPAGWADPPGLIVSPQLGKWKRQHRIGWTAELHRAWQDGDQPTIWEALDAAGN